MPFSQCKRCEVKWSKRLLPSRTQAFLFIPYMVIKDQPSNPPHFHDHASPGRHPWRPRGSLTAPRDFATLINNVY